MAKTTGRPPNAVKPKKGIYEVLSDNIGALLATYMRVHACSETEARKIIASLDRTTPKLSSNTIQRAHWGQQDTGIGSLEKIAGAVHVHPSDLLKEGACKRIMDERFPRSPSPANQMSPQDDARTLQRKGS